MSNILGMGLRSLLAYQSAINVTAQNIENANTPFYSRREVNLVEAMFNNGVNVSDVRRIFDNAANETLLSRTSTESRVQELYEKMSTFETLLDDSTTNVSKFINDSIESLKQLSSSVDSVQSRSIYLSRLSNLAKKFNSLSQEIGMRRSDLNSGIETKISRINQIEEQISKLNTDIRSMSDEDATSLLDQRNTLVNELAKYIDFKSYTDDNNVLTLTLSNGIDLITGTNYYTLSTGQDNTDPSKLRIMLDNDTGSSDVTDILTDGSLIAALQLDENTLDPAERALGRLSLAINDMFNNQNKLGVDADGNLGDDLFNDINSSLLISSRAIANGLNTGSGSMTVSIADTNQLTTSNYKLVFIDATTYSLQRLSDGSEVANGTIGAYPVSISADGFSIDITAGSFSAGDSFLIKPTANAMTNMKIATTNPSKLALGFPVVASPKTDNAGDGKISVDEITDTSNSSFSVAKSLNPPIRIEFLSDTSYQIVNATTSAVIEGPVTYDPSTGADVFPTAGSFDPGYRISISGKVKTGDEFNIGYNVSPVSDNRNALKFIGIYDAKRIGNGVSTISSAYTSLSSDVSLLTNAAKIEYDSAATLKIQAETRFYEISGVSTIEEAGNLSRYQEAYEASAQVIQVAKTIFDTIIGLSRG